MMTARTLPALAALAILPLSGGGAQAEPAAETIRPAYLNIVIEADGSGATPSWRLETLPGLTDQDPFTPQVDCREEAGPPGGEVQTFAVECVAVGDPPPIGGGDVVHVREGWGCGNPGVRATISGPIPGEWVTGRVSCGRPVQSVAQCTAVATTPSLPTGWSGQCAQVGPSSFFPARCEAVVGATLDRWSVTCMTSDP